MRNQVELKTIPQIILFFEIFNSKSDECLMKKFDAYQCDTMEDVQPCSPPGKSFRGEVFNFKYDYQFHLFFTHRSATLTVSRNIKHTTFQKLGNE